MSLYTAVRPLKKEGREGIKRKYGKGRIEGKDSGAKKNRSSERERGEIFIEKMLKSRQGLKRTEKF